MVSVAISIRGRRVSVASLPVPLVVVRRSSAAALRPGLGCGSLCCRFSWRFTCPLLTTVSPVVMISTIAIPRARPLALPLTVIPVIPVPILSVAAAVPVAAGRAVAAARGAVVSRLALAGAGAAGPLAAAVRLRLDAVQRVLQRRDQNLAAVVLRHLALFNE